MSKAIGLDVGHSAVKISVDGAKLIFPTAIIPAFVLHDEVAAMRAKRDTVKVESQTFFVGETAIAQGRCAAAGVMAVARRGDQMAKGLIFAIMVEFYAILCLLASFLMLNSL